MVPQFIKQSALPFPLERFRRNNKDSDPLYAQATRYSNRKFVTFNQGGRQVVDVLVWTIRRNQAISSAKASQKFLSTGYPKRRTVVIVELGQ